MSDLDQILNGEQPEPVVEPEPQEPVPAAAEPVAAEPEPTEPEPAPASAEPEPQMVPIGVVQGLREEIRALKAGMPQPEPRPAPDFYEDPQAAVQHQVAPVQQMVVAQKLETSRFMAEQQYGKETVAAAFEYFNQHPEQSQALLNHPSPFHAAVEAFNQQRVASEIGADPDAWREKEREKLRAELQAELVAKQAQEKAAQAAPSMANVTGTGGGPKAAAWGGPTPLDKVIGS